jgi:GNAT superfamily N-acetyltransferase
MLIRRLDPEHDRPAVAALYRAATDYWMLADHCPPDAAKIATFFTDAPPGCDPAASLHFGFDAGGRLGGVAVLSFGFPDAQSAYLDLMLLAPDQRSQGRGAALLAHVETCARNVRQICLAVLGCNPRGRAFWESHGYADTGLSGIDTDTGNTLHRLCKPL